MMNETQHVLDQTNSVVKIDEWDEVDRRSKRNVQMYLSIAEEGTSSSRNFDKNSIYLFMVSFTINNLKAPKHLLHQHHSHQLMVHGHSAEA